MDAFIDSFCLVERESPPPPEDVPSTSQNGVQENDSTAFKLMGEAFEIVLECLGDIVDGAKKGSITRAECVKITDKYGLTSFLPFDRIPSVVYFYSGQIMFKDGLKLQLDGGKPKVGFYSHFGFKIMFYVFSDF